MADSDYPTLQLDNGKILVSIYLPDPEHGYYRGPRFDWSGIIQRVATTDHHFYAPLYVNHDPELHDSISGPAEEFAMVNPMGFAEARAGESFVKIGVGLLRKEAADEYRFNGNYKIIRAGEWVIEHEPDRVSFLQDFCGERGWAYRYRKTIRLLPGLAELLIGHSLENTGEKNIDIDNYNHNFTLIDDVPYGPGYRVNFPFTTASSVSINELAMFQDNVIEVAEPLGDKSLWMPLFEGPGPVEYNAALIHNQRTGAAVEFNGDTPITRMVFWAVERAVCPEPFIQLNLAPGQTSEWMSRYRYLSYT